MKNTELIGVEALSSFLSYDSTTGIVTWKTDHNSRAKKGQEFGTSHSHRRTSYKQANLLGKCYQVHRVAWALHYGAWPVGQIDHIDHDGLNNRIENLREVSTTDNCRNRRRRRDNKSGVTGVTWCNNTKKWKSEIRVNRRLIYLGVFRSVEEAAKARLAASKEFGFHTNHGKPE